MIVDLIVKPRGRGNWRTSSIRAAAPGFSIGEIIWVGKRLYRIVDIKQVETT